MIMIIILVIITTITIITSATCICYYHRSRFNYLLYFYNHHILHRQDGYHFLSSFRCHSLLFLIIFIADNFFNNYTLMLTWRDGLYIPTLALYCKLQSLISIPIHRYVYALAIFLNFYILTNMHTQVMTKTLQAILPTTCKKGRKMATKLAKFGKKWQLK